MKKVFSIFFAFIFVSTAFFSFVGNVALSQDWRFTRNIHAGQVRGLAVANNRLWVNNTNGNVVVYDIGRTTAFATPLVTATALTVGGTEYPIAGGGDHGRGMNFGHDGKIYHSTATGEVFVIDPTTPLTNPMRAIRRLTTSAHTGSMTAAAATSNGNVVVGGVATANIFAFNDIGGSLTITFAGGTVSAGRDVAISADGNDLFIATLSANTQHWRNTAGTGLSDGVTYTFQRNIPSGSGNVIEIFYDDANKRLWLGVESTPAKFDCYDVSGAEPVQLTALTLESVGTGSSATGGFATIRGSYFDGSRAYVGDAYARVLEFERSNVVKVTIRANTATVPDTLSPNSYIQLRGGDNAFGNWGYWGPLLGNVDGDYWQTTLALTPGTTIEYKFFTNTIGVNGEIEHAGWENDLDPSGNRSLVVPNADIVLPVQFVNGTPNRQLQNFTPLVSGADEVAVMFRVNMQGNQSFNKETQFMAVRGGFPASGGDWSRNFLLTRESPHGNGGSRNYDATNFWSGVTTMPRSMVGSTVQYKFVILNSRSETADVADWEPDRPSGGNRSFVVGGDTTLYWKYWDDGAPVAVTGTDTVIVTYEVNLSTAIRSGGFTPGDTLEVRSGYSSAKYYQSEETPSYKRLIQEGFGNTYRATDTLIGELGGEMYYQYYLWKNGGEVRENFYNFEYTGTENTLAERRSVTLAGTAQWSTTQIRDVVSSSVDIRRQPDFPNQGLLQRDVTVKVICDLRPVYYTLLAGHELGSSQSDVVFRQADAARLYDELGVWINGPMTGGWTWGADLRDSLARKMYDDGTNGDDVAGDRKYTALIQVGPSAGTSDQRRVGQTFKFGVWGEDNEGGYGNNHFANIDDATGTYTLEVPFGSIDPKRYPAWDFDNEAVISVEKLDGVPDKYTLEQNYPNPFNPSTIIRYDIPKSSNVSLKIYDVMGREVTTLVNDVQVAGRYEVVFSAKNISSGVYFYRIIADDFTAIKKMVLMK